MKTQQRNFIVEIKSNGRRSAVRQGSIWGSTDLKAMVRQAASIAPQLFEAARDAESVVGAAASDLPDPAAIPQADHIPAIGFHDQPSAPPEVLVVEPVAAVTATLDCPPEVPVVAPEAAGQTKRPRKRAIERLSRSVPVRKSAALAVIAVDSSLDELALLEVENRRLKADFAAFLRRQNQELRSMLERFDAS